MLAFIADAYTPLLALSCAVILKPIYSKKLFIAFLVAYFYVYSFSFIEFYFSWWLAVGGDFSSHTAAVMVMVFALLSVNLLAGGAALMSMLIYGALMSHLHYHSWFDIVTTMVVCLPCWPLFKWFIWQHVNVKRDFHPIRDKR